MIKRDQVDEPESFFEKMSEAEALFAELQHWDDEQHASYGKISELESILETGDFSEVIREFNLDKYANPISMAKKRIKEFMKANERHIAECNRDMRRVEKVLKRHGLQRTIDAYHAMTARKRAEASSSAEWKVNCDTLLEKQRPCKRVVDNVEHIVPIGASGYSGIDENTTTGRVDILENSPALENDAGDVFNFFKEEDDAEEKEEAFSTRTSGAILVNSIRLNASLAGQLKPHQKDAVERMIQRIGVEMSGFLLAHSMGLGKTLTTIAVVEALSNNNTSFRTLVVCPKSLMSSWYAELEKWEQFISFNFFEPLKDDQVRTKVSRWIRNAGLLIMTHERFRRLYCNNVSLPADLLIVDEAHLLKNTANLLYQAVEAHGTQRKLLLTGSPLQNHLMEYCSMIRLVQPTLFDEDSFKKTYAKVIDKGALADASEEERAKGRTMICALTLLTEACVHRRSVAVLAHALPPMQDYKLTYTCELPPFSPSMGPLEMTHQVITHSMGRKCSLAKMLLLSISKHSDDLTLVFSKRKDVLQHLNQMVPGLLMDGDTKATERQDLIDTFNKGETKVFYMTTRVGGVGLNLQVANRIIILDPSWNPVDDKQACFRCYRYGQVKPVTIYRFVVYQSIEERIYRYAVHKNLAACRIIDEKDVERHFTTEQLKALDDFDEKYLTTTQDKALNKILAKFESCSSHSVLFADAEAEVLSPEELGDANNEYNKIICNQPSRKVDDHEVLMNALYLDDGTLIPPMVPCYIGADEERPCAIRFHPFQPISDQITKFQVEVHRCQTDDTYILNKTFKEIGMRPLLTLCKGEHKIRIRMSVNDVMSDWSEWSASVFV